MKYDWKKDDVEHLERRGCIINIREGLSNLENESVTSIEILTDEGWILKGSVNNQVINEVKEEDES